MLSAIPVDAVALAADDTGIYWTTSDSQLMVLRTGHDAPERLGGDTGGGQFCGAPKPPLLAGGFVFWLGSARSALHRTRAAGGGDEVLTRAVRGDNLAADAANVYWTDVLGRDAQGSGAIRMLSQGARAGDAPLTLATADVNEEISSLAVRDGAVYWTPFGTIGSTMYTSVLRSAPLAELVAGRDPGTVPSTLTSPFGLSAGSDAIYFAQFANLWTTVYARLPGGNGPAELLATLPIEQTGRGVAIAGDNLLLSASATIGCGQQPSLKLFAAPAQGGQPVLIADEMRTPAIAAPDGVVYVGGDGRLTAMSVAYAHDLRVALAP